MKTPKYFSLIVLCVLAVLYTSVTGWHYGKVKAEVWKCTIGVTFLAIVFVLVPCKILAVSVFKTFLINEPHSVLKIERFDMSHQPQELEQLKRRCSDLSAMLRKSLYEPIGFEERERIHNKLHKERRMENLLSEMILFVALLATLTLLSVQGQRGLAFHSSRQIENYLVNGKSAYFPLSNVINDKDLQKHFEDVFLPAIHNGTDAKDQRIIDGNGWLDGKVVRMLGVPRLRQLRSQYFPCNRRTCVHEFTKATQETRNFGVRWKDEKPFRYEKKFWRIVDPWKFQSGGRLAHEGKLAVYPGNGYMSQLGRTQNNSYAVLRFLMKTEWIDRRTKALFIETTFYSVDSGVYNVVTLGLERTPFGNWITSHEVFTASFETGSRYFWKYFGLVLFILIVLTLAKRTISKMSSPMFFRKISNIVDVVIICNATAWIISLILRNVIVNQLLQLLKTLMNNEFVNFQAAAMSDVISDTLYGTLVSITAVRLWNILNFSKTFRAMNLTIYYAAGALLSTAFLLFVFLIGFSGAVHIINGAESELFSSLINTFTTMTAQTLKFSRTIHNESVENNGIALSLSLFAFLMLFISILLMNMVTSIVVVYNKRVKDKMKIESQEKVSLLSIVKKKLRRLFGMKEERELSFMHRNYTMNRADHIKRTIDAQLEFLEKYVEVLRSGECLHTFSMIIFVRSWTAF